MIESRSMADALRDIRELVTHPGWNNHILPLLLAMEVDHTEAAISPKLAPKDRAEHIQAIQSIRKIINFPATRTKELEASWKQSQRKPASA